MHRPARKNFERRSVSSYYNNDLWAADLVDMSNIKEDNHDITFLLNIIDIYSRFAWSIPLKNKKASTVLQAFKSIKIFPKNLG